MIFNPIFLQEYLNPFQSKESATKFQNANYLFADIMNVYEDEKNKNKSADLISKIGNNLFNQDALESTNPQIITQTELIKLFQEIPNVIKVINNDSINNNSNNVEEKVSSSFSILSVSEILERIESESEIELTLNDESNTIIKIVKQFSSNIEIPSGTFLLSKISKQNFSLSLNSDGNRIEELSGNNLILNHNLKQIIEFVKKVIPQLSKEEDEIVENVSSVMNKNKLFGKEEKNIVKNQVEKISGMLAALSQTEAVRIDDENKEQLTILLKQIENELNKNYVIDDTAKIKLSEANNRDVEKSNNSKLSQLEKSVFKNNESEKNEVYGLFIEIQKSIKKLLKENISKSDLNVKNEVKDVTDDMIKIDNLKQIIEFVKKVIPQLSKEEDEIVENVSSVMNKNKLFGKEEKNIVKNQVEKISGMLAALSQAEAVRIDDENKEQLTILLKQIENELNKNYVIDDTAKIKLSEANNRDVEKSNNSKLPQLEKSVFKNNESEKNEVYGLFTEIQKSIKKLLKENIAKSDLNVKNEVKDVTDDIIKIGNLKQIIEFVKKVIPQLSKEEDEIVENVSSVLNKNKLFGKEEKNIVKNQVEKISGMLAALSQAEAVRIDDENKEQLTILLKQIENELNKNYVIDDTAKIKLSEANNRDVEKSNNSKLSQLEKSVFKNNESQKNEVYGLFIEIQKSIKKLLSNAVSTGILNITQNNSKSDLSLDKSVNDVLNYAENKIHIGLPNQNLQRDSSRLLTQKNANQTIESTKVRLLTSTDKYSLESSVKLTEKLLKEISNVFPQKLNEEKKQVEFSSYFQVNNTDIEVKSSTNDSRSQVISAKEFSSIISGEKKSLFVESKDENQKLALTDEKLFNTEQGKRIGSEKTYLIQIISKENSISKKDLLYPKLDSSLSKTGDEILNKLKKLKGFSIKQNSYSTKGNISISDIIKAIEIKNQEKEIDPVYDFANDKKVASTIPNEKLTLDKNIHQVIQNDLKLNANEDKTQHKFEIGKQINSKYEDKVVSSTKGKEQLLSASSFAYKNNEAEESEQKTFDSIYTTENSKQTNGNLIDLKGDDRNDKQQTADKNLLKENSAKLDLKTTSELKNNFDDILSRKITNEINSENRSTLQDTIKTIHHYELQNELNKVLNTSQSKIVTLKIMPENMGKVNINLEVKENVMNVKINVENENIKQLIQTSSEQLKNSLTENGIHLASLTVNLTNTDDKGSNRHIIKVKKRINHSNENFTADDDKIEIKPKNMGYNTYDYIM